MMLLKPGREYLDPLNRIVTLVKVETDSVTIKLRGPYGATIKYPPSCLKEIQDDELL
jgi:hypothetical protein